MGRSAANNANRPAAVDLARTDQDDEIRGRGASQHNLKNVDVTIPRNKLVDFTGVSGSGTSSLAFDTIIA